MALALALLGIGLGLAWRGRRRWLGRALAAALLGLSLAVLMRDPGRDWRGPAVMAALLAVAGLYIWLIRLLRRRAGAGALRAEAEAGLAAGAVLRAEAAAARARARRLPQTDADTGTGARRGQRILVLGAPGPCAAIRRGLAAEAAPGGRLGPVVILDAAPERGAPDLVLLAQPDPAACRAVPRGVPVLLGRGAGRQAQVTMPDHEDLAAAGAVDGAALPPALADLIGALLVLEAVRLLTGAAGCGMRAGPA